jgi:hypothetical protein
MGKTHWVFQALEKREVIFPMVGKECHAKKIRREPESAPQHVVTTDRNPLLRSSAFHAEKWISRAFCGQAM